MTVDLDRLRTLHHAATDTPHGDAAYRAAIAWGRAIDAAAPDLFDELEDLRAEVERLRNANAHHPDGGTDGAR